MGLSILGMRVQAVGMQQPRVREVLQLGEKAMHYLEWNLRDTLISHTKVASASPKYSFPPSAACSLSWGVLPRVTSWTRAQATSLDFLMCPWDQLAHPMGACVLTWTLLYQGGSLDSGACKGNGPGQGAVLEGLTGHRGSASSPPALSHFQEEVWERSPAPGAKALLLPFLTLEIGVQVPGLTSLHPYPLSEPVLGLWEPWVWADRCPGLVPSAH